jgi:hypothetical protein
MKIFILNQQWLTNNSFSYTSADLKLIVRGLTLAPLTSISLNTACHSQSVFQNSAEGDNSDTSESVVFSKIQKIWRKPKKIDEVEPHEKQETS